MFRTGQIVALAYVCKRGETDVISHAIIEVSPGVGGLAMPPQVETLASFILNDAIAANTGWRIVETEDDEDQCYVRAYLPPWWDAEEFVAWFDEAIQQIINQAETGQLDHYKPHNTHLN